MHRKLNDITDKQFNLEELSATYNVSKAKETPHQRMHINCTSFLKLKSRLGLK
jgi:DNA polymerase-3 subunit epsilon